MPVCDIFNYLTGFNLTGRGGKKPRGGMKNSRFLKRGNWAAEHGRTLCGPLRFVKIMKNDRIAINFRGRNFFSTPPQL